MKKNVKINGRKLNPFNLHELKLSDSSGLCKQSKATNTVWMSGCFMLFHTIIQYRLLLHNFYNDLNDINGWKQIILLQSAVPDVKDSMPSKPVWPESCWRNLSEHT